MPSANIAAGQVCEPSTANDNCGDDLEPERAGLHHDRGLDLAAIAGALERDGGAILRGGKLSAGPHGGEGIAGAASHRRERYGRDGQRQEGKGLNSGLSGINPPGHCPAGRAVTASIAMEFPTDIKEAAAICRKPMSSAPNCGVRPGGATHER